MLAILKSMGNSGLILIAFALVAGVALSLTNLATKNLIQYNEQQFLLQKLNKIIPKYLYDNNLSNDTKQIAPDTLLGTTENHTAYLARKNNKIIAVFLNPIAKGGYNGDINLLVAVRANQSVAGVRVVKHRETVGLADGIEDTKSDWVLGFNQKNLTDGNIWRVKKDGGEFDQFTGATISPRAIVKAVKNTLIYVRQHPELFE